jgi:hypothetical protein
LANYFTSSCVLVALRFVAVLPNCRIAVLPNCRVAVLPRRLNARKNPRIGAAADYRTTAAAEHGDNKGCGAWQARAVPAARILRRLALPCCARIRYALRGASGAITVIASAGGFRHYARRAL